jgi:hypothetical protein
MGGLTDEISTERDGSENNKNFSFRLQEDRQTGRKAARWRRRKGKKITCTCNINCTVLKEKNKSFFLKKVLPGITL